MNIQTDIQTDLMKLFSFYWLEIGLLGISFRHTDKQIDKDTDRWTYRPMNIQTDRWTYRLMNIQTDRQTDLKKLFSFCWLEISFLGIDRHTDVYLVPETNRQRNRHINIQTDRQTDLMKLFSFCWLEIDLLVICSLRWLISWPNVFASHCWRSLPQWFGAWKCWNIR